MTEKKFSLGWYVFAFVGGVVSGGLFSKAMYHKGQADAYFKIGDELQEVIDKTEEALKQAKESV